MKIYSKYILLYLTRIFLLNTLLLIAILVSVKLLTLLNNHTINGLANLQIAFKLVLVSVPALLVYLSPIALLCTIMYVYYTLSMDSEFIILEATGLSKFNIARPAIQFAAAITILSYYLTMFTVPLAKRDLNNYIDFMRNSLEISSILEEKSFNRISRHTTLYVDKKGQDNIFYGIAIYNKESNNSQTIILAEKAELRSEEGKFLFHLYDGNRQSINNGSLQILYFKTLSFNIPKTNTSLSSSKNLVLEEQTIFELLSHNTRKNFNLNERNAEINQRLSWPMINFAIACIALCTSFSTHFERKWNTQKLIYVSIFSALAFGLVIISSRKINNSFIFALTLYIVPIIFSITSLYILRKKSDNKLILPLKIYNQLPENIKRLID